MSKAYDHNRNPQDIKSGTSLSKNIRTNSQPAYLEQIQQHFLMKMAVSENARKGKTQ
jgi:hypothetical protein